ncbi:MAG: hypothetical protein IKC32_06420 [Clostridia bacterium]|nr:hypothetical protein [Clostridia bacterium]
MYCVKCGVELADSEHKCPLCMTPVYFPELKGEKERPYPEALPVEEKVNLRGLNFILTFAVILAGVISVVADVNTGAGFSWSGLVVGALIQLYITLVFPLWFVRRSPSIFVPVSFAWCAVYLLYICIYTGGDWYLTLALPVLGGFALICTAVTTLIYYIKRGYLYIFGGASIALGALCILIEWLLHVTFTLPVHHIWSPYPAIALGLFGIMLIVIAIVKPLRESLARIFAL